METRDFVLLVYGAFDGQISGRTRLQKDVYFVAEVVEEDHGFGPHYYGPYSANVSEVNSELRDLGYLKEDVTVYGFDHRGFEMARYDYSLTKDGLALLSRKKKLYPQEWKKIHSAAQIIKNAGSIDYMEFAMAAKIYMVLDKQGGKADRETMRSVAKSFGWSIDEEELERAMDILEKLGLAHWERSNVDN
jgi:uncharacterized protein